MAAARTEDVVRKVISELTPDQCDVLMKFIYRGLEAGANSAMFLKWHARTLEKAGKGSIMRVLTDKKNLV
jgi:hypothetical protein